MPRACRILGVTPPVVMKLAAEGRFRYVDFRERGWKKIHYHSLVDYLNNLREEYAIPDGRPKLDNPIFRHRDVDLPPFPLADTVFPPQCADAIGVSPPVIYSLAEEGRFWAYRLSPEGHWRISATSFQRWVASRCEGPQAAARTGVNEASEGCREGRKLTAI